MKKMMFLMLTLLIMGAANVNAQVQIGGTKGPDKSAVLDLNGDAGNAKGGLALPRVELTSNTQQLNGATAQPGTVVYNTSSALDGEGTYVWTKVDGGNGGTAFTGVEIKNGANNVVLAGKGIVGNELSATVAANGITATQLANNAVTTTKIGTVKADSGKILVANGNSASWRVFGFTRHIVSSDSVKNLTNTTTAVTWTKSGTATIGVPRTEGGAYEFPWPGMTHNQYCVSDVGHAIVTWTNKITILCHDPSPAPFVLHIQCYKPSV
jgi:hypothetical protein